MAARVAAGLLRLADQHGRIVKGGTLIDLKLSQRDLGSYLGLSRENVSRQLGLFRDIGVLRIEGSEIVILDRDALREYSEGPAVEGGSPSSLATCPAIPSGQSDELRDIGRDPNSFRAHPDHAPGARYERDCSPAQPGLRRCGVATILDLACDPDRLLMLLAGRSDFAEQRRERIFDADAGPLVPGAAARRSSLSISTGAPWPPRGMAMGPRQDRRADRSRRRCQAARNRHRHPHRRRGRALAGSAGSPPGGAHRQDDVARLADTLPDGNQQLAAAFKKAPTTLGVALAPSGATTGPLDPGARPRSSCASTTSGMPRASSAPCRRSWRLPHPAWACCCLPGDVDGRVRRAPLMAVVGGQLWPSLAVEVVRTYGGASAMLLSADTGRLEIAGRAVPIGSNGMLRLLPLRHDLWADRTVSALDVLDSAEDAQRFAGRIVLIGSSAPELGGLRSGGSRPSRPVRHAACCSCRADPQRHGANPQRAIEVVEVDGALAACVLATWLAHVLSPLDWQPGRGGAGDRCGPWAPRLCCGGNSCSSIRSSRPRHHRHLFHVGGVLDGGSAASDARRPCAGGSSSIWHPRS